MEPRINRLCGRGKNTNPQHLKQHSQTCRKGKEMAITHLIVGEYNMNKEMENTINQQLLPCRARFAAVNL